MTLPIEGPVRVVVDVDTIDTDGEQERFLMALLSQDDVELYKYSDHGPPPGEVLQPMPRTRYSGAPGWLSFCSSDKPTWDDQGWVTYRINDDRWHCSAVRGRGDFLEIRTFVALERLGEHAPNPEQARNDQNGLLAASAAKAQLFVTNRPVLLDQPSVAPFVDVCPASNVEDAITTLGLWLRAKGTYIVLAEGRGKATVDRHAFYMIGLRNLLQDSWRWGHGCTASGDRDLHDLALALHRRLVTALKTRDRARSATFFMAPEAARDEVLECVDAVAINLMAAFDVAARVAHQVLQIQKPRPSWSFEKWTDQLPRPGLGTVRDSHADVLKVIGKLRNTIHEKALHLGLGDLRVPEADYYVVLPTAPAAELKNSFEALGGLPSWGIREIGPDRLWADPFQLMEQMLCRGIYTLDQILAATPVETAAPGVALRTGPSADSWAWSARARRNVGWQFALRQYSPADHPASAQEGSR